MKVQICLILLFCLFLSACNSSKTGKPRVLVFTKTVSFSHASIPAGREAILKLGKEHGFDVDTTSDASWFNEDTLKKYAAVIFLNTADNQDALLNNHQEADFERYIQAGGGYVGIHAAADAGYRWGWYGRLVGAYFNGHPDQQQTAELHVADADDSSTHFLPKVWSRKDEWYNYKNQDSDLHVLLTLDEKTYKGGTNGSNHPIAWYHAFDGGRAWYTGLGHTEASYSEPLFLKHILGGITYAIGGNKELDYSKARSLRTPDDDRFVKTQLAVGTFFEPTEMTLLPNFDILVLQRRGEIMLYKHDTHQVKQAGFFNVYFKTSTPGVNAEEGMLGLAKDPDFEKNNWIYIYYSPADSSVNRLSRFTFRNDTVDKATEKVVLEVKAQRDICCHTGGSIAFGPDKLLYFSAGDNSTPFDEKGVPYVNNGFAPLNDVPGHKQYDARRSAGNSNDLRGKIMRIRVRDDGSYEIPEGNLFPKGMEKTRPEIYVMGDRNPYRITVDQKNSYLYWGEVGPDANNDSLATRGPRGYDEVNQARRAGNFGWPYFVGNNQPYREFDYATGKSGAAFDPAKPLNNSRNNTGLRELPPAQSAFIWYPYAKSPDFPQVGTGGRNAMAGPVYYTDLFPEETRLPDYYNGKLFIYDWVRGWIKAVTMKSNGDFDKMEPFFPDLKLNSLIDMEVGKDGRLYLLEYGNGWFSKNADAGLARIDYIAGNRPPHISSVTVDKTSGDLPLTVTLRVQAKDPEKDAVTYRWNLGNGHQMKTSSPELRYTYTTAGDYKITVEARDSKDAFSTSKELGLYAGNQRPEVSISLGAGNKTFFSPGLALTYHVNVNDGPETQKVDRGKIFVSQKYAEGLDQAVSAAAHEQDNPNAGGENLMLSLDCKSCHKTNEKSIGPSFTQVSSKYKNQAGAQDYLIKKIIKGGGGVWGPNEMSAHPNLKPEDAGQIVSWVLSLAKASAAQKSLAAEGKIQALAQKPGSVLILAARYTDEGNAGSKPLSGSAFITLRNAAYGFTGKERSGGFSSSDSAGDKVLEATATQAWFAIDSIDLTGIRSLSIGSQAMEKTGPVQAEIRLDKPDGTLLAQASIPASVSGIKKETGVNLAPVNDGRFHNLYVIFKAGELEKYRIIGLHFSLR